MSHEPRLRHNPPVLGAPPPAPRQTVNLVITAVLLASLVCLLIIGGVAGGPDEPSRPRPATEPPLTNESSERTASDAGATARPS